MNDLRALGASVKILVFVAALLMGLAGLVSAGVDQVIVPPPENTAEQFMSALAAHRYEGAMNQLSSQLLTETSPQELKDLNQQLEESQRGIRDAHGQDAQQQGQTATAVVTVKLDNLDQCDLEFQLVQEHGLWKVDSLEPVDQLLENRSC